MRTRWAQAAVVLLVSVAAVLWLAHGLRATHLDAEAQTAAQNLDPQSPTQVRHLESLYERASGFNADPTPRIGEASLEISRGRVARAIPILERVVKANPGNIPATTLLLRALAPSDPARVTAVARDLRRLYGRVGARSERLSVRDRRGQLFPVVTDWVTGLMDGTRATGGHIALSGWAASRSARAPADEILVFVGGRLVRPVVRRLPRPDINKALSLPGGPYGFNMLLPRSSVVPTEPEIFAVQGGLATQIPFRR